MKVKTHIERMATFGRNKRLMAYLDTDADCRYCVSIYLGVNVQYGM